jgi:hypothetical protein
MKKEIIGFKQVVKGKISEQDGQMIINWKSNISRSNEKL